LSHGCKARTAKLLLGWRRCRSRYWSSLLRGRQRCWLRTRLDDALLRTFTPRQNHEVDEQREHHEQCRQDCCCLGKEIRSPSDTEYCTKIARAQSARKSTALAGLHQDNNHQQNADKYLDRNKECVHKPSS